MGTVEGRDTVNWRGTEEGRGRKGTVSRNSSMLLSSTASPPTCSPPLMSAPSIATSKALSDTGVCCSGVPHLTSPHSVLGVLVCVVCGETHQQHCLVVTPVTSSLRGAHPPVSSTAVIIWRAVCHTTPLTLVYVRYGTTLT